MLPGPLVRKGRRHRLASSCDRVDEVLGRAEPKAYATFHLQNILHTVREAPPFNTFSMYTPLR